MTRHGSMCQLSEWQCALLAFRMAVLLWWCHTTGQRHTAHQVGAAWGSSLAVRRSHLDLALSRVKQRTATEVGAPQVRRG